MEVINFDANATTKMSDDVVDIRNYLESRYGLLNMSKQDDARVKKLTKIINRITRRTLNELRLGARYNVVFTSGSSESNSQIAKTLYVLSQEAPARSKVIVSSIEHKSMLLAIQSYFSEENIVYVKPDSDTFKISLSGFQKALYMAGGRDKVIGAVVMAANNETGIINEFGTIARACKHDNIWFHCDATQYIGKFADSLAQCTSISASAHKFNGPKGKGFLFVDGSQYTRLVPLIYGTQQHHVRGGTLDHVGNYLALSALKIAHANRKEKNVRMRRLANIIRTHIRRAFPNATIIPADLPNVVAVLFGFEAGKPIYNSNMVQRYFDKYGVMIGVGSACNDDDSDLSYVIAQLETTDAYAPKYWNRNFVRISFDDTISEANVTTLLSLFDQFKNGLR